MEWLHLQHVSVNTNILHENTTTAESTQKAFGPATVPARVGGTWQLKSFASAYPALHCVHTVQSYPAVCTQFWADM